MKKDNKFKIKKKFAVLQLGARRGYVVPHILFQNQNLKVIYTDIHSNHLFFKILKLIIPKKILPKKFKSLLSRQLPSNFLKKFVKDLPFLAILFNSRSEKITKFVLDKALNDEFFGANAIYTNFINNDIEYIKKAKDKGIFIVHEMYISPDSGLIMYEENKRFLELNVNCEKLEDIEKGISQDRKKWELSDQILVPSKYCKDSAIKMGADSKKISVVPYGVKKEFFNLQTNVQKGKVLFVGEVGLRKGAHYLAKASRILSARGRKYNFVAAGFSTINSKHSLLDGIKLLGHLSESELIYQYLTSDLFVLPTLVEGMAVAHLEAMACGLPVVTTPKCGSVISDSREGFIVPIRDPHKLALKIEEIIEHRDLRNEMSIRCRKKVMKYTWDEYRKNLLSALGI